MRQYSASGAVAAAVVAVSLLTTAHADDRTRKCTPVDVGVFENRLHVQCEPLNGQAYTTQIRYYAMKMSDSEQFDATLQLLLMAKAHDRPLRLSFDDADYASVPGCQGGDCRRLRWVSMR